MTWPNISEMTPMETTQSFTNKNLVVPSVSDIVHQIKGALEQWVGTVTFQGEISEFFLYRSSGHWYFTLKDRDAQIKCAMFAGANQRVKFQPKVGDLVQVTGSIDVYQKSGQMQCIVRTMKRAGAGNLYEEFLRLKEKLNAEGLFSESLKRPLPFVPQTVGVVTSTQTAALRDVLIRLKDRAPYVNVIVYPTPVQGYGAGDQIAQALNTASSRKEVDVLLLVRGGGSIEDLWAFNEEVVARAIRACRIPVITGIGHESDITIADLAADKREATPSAAAERAAQKKSDLLNTVDHYFSTIQRSYRKESDNRNLNLDFYARDFQDPLQCLRPFKDALDRISEHMKMQVLNLIHLQERQCNEASQQFFKEKIELSAYRERIRNQETRLIFSKQQCMEDCLSGYKAVTENLINNRPQVPKDYVDQLIRNMVQSADSKAIEVRSDYQKAIHALQLNKPKLSIENFNRIRENLCHNNEIAFHKTSERLQLAVSTLSAVDPKLVLKRGYTWVAVDGRIVSSTKDLKTGENVQISFSDGSADARIVSVSSSSKNQKDDNNKTC